MTPENLIERAKTYVVVGSDGHEVNLGEEIERLRAALFPFATSLKIARDAFDGPTDQGHLRAVAMNYIHIADLCNAFDAMRNVTKEPSK